jgi:hypothetical protein
MPIVRFIGTCHPGSAITIRGLPKMGFTFGHIRGLIGVDVFGGTATITFELETFDFEKDHVLLNSYAHYTVKTFVDVIEFQCGMPVSVNITQAHYPGEILPTMLKMTNPGLEGICTVCRVSNNPNDAEVSRDDSFLDLLQMVMNDWNLRFALDALTYSLDFPEMAAVNCARTIEHIRHMVAPGKDRKSGWRIMQNTLNIGQNYLESVSQTSVGPRHGDFSPDLLHSDVRRKTWIVMNRYLEFRKRGGTGALPLSVFPLLTDSTPPFP